VVFALRKPSDVPHLAVFGLGALVAVATLVRPTFWFYPVVVVVLLAVRFRGAPTRSLVTQLLAFLLPIVVVVGGWQLRNHEAVGSWQVSGVSGMNLYCYNAAEVEALVADTSITDARARLDCTTRYPNPEGICTRDVGFGCWSPDPHAAGQGFDEWGRKGLDILTDHPPETARVVAEGVLRQVAGPGRDMVGRYLGGVESLPLTMGLVAWNASLWALAAIGAVAGLRSEHRAFWAFLIATIGYVMVISAGTAADARFRAPLVPLLAVVAAMGVRITVRSLGVGRSPTPRARDRELAAAASAR
jgi:hypothetical protein